MVFLIRYIFIFFISSCTYIDALFEFRILNEDDKIVNEDFQKLKTSSAIYLVNKKKSLATLINKDNELEKWQLNNSVVLISNNGKIVKSIGLKYDFELINYKNFTDIKTSSKALLKFKDPDSGYLNYIYSYKQLPKHKHSEHRVIEENFSVPLISWNGKNYYWLDENGVIIKSEQMVSPFGDKIVLEKVKYSN